MTTLFIAAGLGLAFGFILDRVGAANPNILLRMLTLRDLHLAKTILLGIGLASTLMFLGIMAGFVDVGHMSVKTTYLGVLIGGLIFGIGWAVSGFCPGTAVASLGTLRKDAVAFVGGGLVGALAYSVTYPMWKAAGVLEGDKPTAGVIEGAAADGALGLPGQIVGVVLGLVLIGLAFALPRFPLGAAKEPTADRSREAARR